MNSDRRGNSMTWLIIWLAACAVSCVWLVIGTYRAPVWEVERAERLLEFSPHLDQPAQLRSPNTLSEKALKPLSTVRLKSRLPKAAGSNAAFPKAVLSK